MAVTYTYGNDPVIAGTAAQKRDAVRFLAQDKTGTTMRVTDEEIAFLISTESSAWEAAACVCDIIAARLGPGGAVEIRSGDFTERYDATMYRDRANQLRARAATCQTPYLGGMTYTDKDTDEDNTDRVEPEFYRGMRQVDESTLPEDKRPD